MYICNYFAEIDFRIHAADVLDYLPGFEAHPGSSGWMVAAYIDHAFIHPVASAVGGGLFSDKGLPVQNDLGFRLFEIYVETVEDLIQEHVSGYRILGSHGLVIVLLSPVSQV